MRFITRVRYRYRLERVLDPTNPRSACVIMLNPSTADDSIDDRTIISLKAILGNNGYGCFTVGNVFSIRATNPADLKRMHFASIDVWGGHQMVALRHKLLREADDVVVAWGNTDLRWAGFEPGDTLKHVRQHTDSPLCFGTNKNGTPKHPLYLPHDTKLVPFNG